MLSCSHINKIYILRHSIRAVLGVHLSSSGFEEAIAWPIAQLPDCPDADCPNCENNRWWGRLWMLPIVYWNALSVEGVGRRANL